MRVLALTVGRNEADRYLEQMLENTAKWVDGHFFFDDQSTDGTVDIATYWCEIMVRPDGVPTFLEHEGRLRQFAWDRFVERMNPEVGDWVLAIDCDEFLVGNDHADLRLAAERAGKANAIFMPIPEVFDVADNGWPFIRTDGFWGTIRGTRLFRWQPRGIFRDAPMGSGSEPTYATKPPHATDHGDVFLMHYGYARYEDQVAKHERYTRLVKHGHADRHIQSIIEPPTLKAWAGPWLVVNRP